MDKKEIIARLALGAVKQLVEQEKYTDIVKVEVDALNHTLTAFVQVVGCQPSSQEVGEIRTEIHNTIEFYQIPKKEPLYVVLRRDEAGFLRLVAGPMSYTDAMARVETLYDEPEGYAGFADPLDSIILPHDGSDLVTWR